MSSDQKRVELSMYSEETQDVSHICVCMCVCVCVCVCKHTENKTT